MPLPSNNRNRTLTAIAIVVFILIVDQIIKIAVKTILETHLLRRVIFSKKQKTHFPIINSPQTTTLTRTRIHHQPIIFLTQIIGIVLAIVLPSTGEPAQH